MEAIKNMPRDSQRRRPRPGPGHPCYFCQEVGHFKRNCPKFLASQVGQQGGQQPGPQVAGGDSVGTAEGPGPKG